MPDHEPQLAVAQIERGLESLADEIGRLLDTAPSAEREALHDYAVSLVRDKLPPVEPHTEMIAEHAAESGSNSTSLLGYGMLLFPVGFLMLLVFAPLGALLLVTGASLVVVGGVTGLLPRGRRTSECDGSGS